MLLPLLVLAAQAVHVALAPSPSIRARAASARSALRLALPPEEETGPVLVVGSINIDLYAKLREDRLSFGGSPPVDVMPVKGMTLPAASFVEKLDEAGLGGAAAASDPISLVQSIDGPFVQKTGGKGANAAAAAGQTAACEFIGNLGSASSEANTALLADMQQFGGVNTEGCSELEGPTGTAYILQFEDNDNAIVLVGGANQDWPGLASLLGGNEGSGLRAAIGRSSAVMLQREVPDHVNVAVAQCAAALGKDVFMDVGGTDSPLDPALLPYLGVVAPNESELTFITGVETKGPDGKPELQRVRAAVAALKDSCRAAGNPSVEVLVTFGGEGSLHFGAGWDGAGEAAADGALPLECRMGSFVLGTADGRPVDTTGAGDCFRGSYVAARYADGKGVAESLRWAAAAASLACEVEGAMVSMPDRASICERLEGPMVGAPPASPGAPAPQAEMPAGLQPASAWGIGEVSPDASLVQRVEGKSRKTWRFSDLSRERVQVAVSSAGRPVHADIQLWLGPDWTPYTLRAYSEDGKRRPVQTLVGTRCKAAMVEVRNLGESEFPFAAAANYAKDPMASLPIELPASTPGERVDGGALRSFALDPAAGQVEVVLLTDGRQLNARVELLVGPNNPKQSYEVFTNNGELNSLCVAFDTPDAGATVRVVNHAPVEFPCYIHVRERRV